MPLNHSYRVVFNQSLGAWVAAPETARARGKGGRSAAVIAAVSLFLGALAPLHSHAGPVGGTVTWGGASISQSGATTTITQATPKASLTWQGFDTTAGETVNFVQPSASAIAVNRVLGTKGTEFFGRLNANGQVYLVNPNGILFGPTAQVNVGGLVASTLDLDDASLDGSARTFSGTGAGRVVNEGHIQGRYVALLGGSVSNRGSIGAPRGAAALGAGSTVTLTFADNDLVKLNVDRSTVETLAENGGLIQADGGRVFLSAGAKDALLASVVNNTGVIEARTVENLEGNIVLLGGMTGPGRVNVGGTLDASAPAGGNGGFIETSAASVKVADDARIRTLAGPGGRHGTWLIDPVDFTIAAQGGDITGAALGAQLAGGNVTILSTQGTAGVDGDIHVDDVVGWDAGTRLELSAHRNININRNITAAGDGAGLVLTADNTGTGSGDYVVGRGASVTLSGAASNLTIAGQAYTVINNSQGNGAALLQGVPDLAARYALGEDIDLSSIANFTPIGPTFTGTLAGMGHGIHNLAIDSTVNNAGLIARNAGTVRDLSLVNANVAQSAQFAGTLAGVNAGSIRDVVASGTVTSSSHTVGGLLGNNESAGTVTRAGADVTVTASTTSSNSVGGLVGQNSGTLLDVYATGAVSGAGNVGGLVGYHAGTMARAYASGDVIGTSQVGGLAGGFQDYGVATQVYATGSVSGSSYVGGLVGYNLGQISFAHASGAVTGSSMVGGVVGQNGYWYSYTYSCGRSTCGGSYSYPGYISSAYWDTQSTGQASAGYNYSGGISATGRTTTQAMSQSSYVGWDFANTWVMYEGSTRPLLRAFMTPLTVTATSQVKTYDGQAYAGGNGVSYSVTPNAANLLGTVSYTGSSQGATNVGSYTITPGGLYSNQQGYLISYADGSLAIDPASITVSTSDVTKTYDGTTTAAGTAVVASGTLYGTDSLSGGTFAFTDKNAGIGNKAVTVGGVSVNDGNGGANYVVTFADNTTSTIERAVLTAAMTATDKIYDGDTAAAATFVITSGLLGSETVTASGTAAFANKNAGTDKTVTATSVTLADGDDGGLASNYTLAAGQTALADITPKALVVSGITASDKTYNGSVAATVSTAGVVLGGLVAGDALTVSATGTFADKNVGTGKVVTLASSYGGADAGNYDITGQASTTASITPKALAVSGITASDKTYDGSAAATVSTAGAVLGGLVAGDALTVSATGTFADKNVGAGKVVTLASSYGGADAGNYDITGQASTSASITPKALAVSGITASDKTYDGTAAAAVSTAGAVLGGLVAGDALTVSATGTFADKNVGNGKVVTLASSYGGADAGNYDITGQASTNASITPKALAVSGITASDKTYDGSAAATVSTAGAVLGGLVAGDALTVSATGTFADKNVGTGKVVTLASSYGGADLGNYDITGQASTNASITPKALAVSGITASDKTYDGTAAAAVNTAGAVLGGLVAGDALTVSATGTFADKNVGAGKVVTLASSYGGADAGNYDITGQASTNASITPKALVVSANPDARTSDGTPYAGGNGVTYRGFVAGETAAVLNGSLAYGGSSQGASAAGAYSITPYGLASTNYVLSYVDGLLTIGAAAPVASPLLPAAPSLPSASSSSADQVLAQTLLRNAPADQPATLLLLNCSGNGLAASDATCSSAQRPEGPREAGGTPQSTLRIVDGGVRLPAGSASNN